MLIPTRNRIQQSASSGSSERRGRRELTQELLAARISSRGPLRKRPVCSGAACGGVATPLASVSVSKEASIMHSGKLRVDPDGGRTRPSKRAKHFHPMNSPVVCLSSSGIEQTQPTEQREPNLEPPSMPSAEKVEYKIAELFSIEHSRPQENKVPIDLAGAVTGINSEKDLRLGSHSSTRQEPERSAFGEESSKDEPERSDCSGSILDLDFSVWEDSLPSTQSRKELDLPDLDGTSDHPLIELIDTDSLEGDTSTEQGKTIHPHESSQKHEADM
ncbi:hypothetical protein NDU88_000326 [Pleurodeles waltl]|uniref:Uncharacterized protein n=1 Tax=Pleurodeles waltl TaxID=8319 RepID=A0AAV7TFH8_PLEWA|nr:hypothetical protein NDU88_000326 [Pleurodeles waltl]